MVEGTYSILTLSGNEMSLSQYFNHFLSRRKAAEACGMNMATEGLITALSEAKITELNVLKTDPIYKAWVADVKTHTNEQFFAQVFIRQAGDKFNACRRELQNDFAKGTNHLPRIVDDAYALLQNYDSATRANRNNNNRSNNGGKQGIQSEDKGNNNGPNHSFQQQNFR